MNRLQRIVLSSGLVIAMTCGGGAVFAPAIASAQATKPSARPGKQVDPAQEAARDLVKEARESLRAKKPFPRTSSDYFKTAADEKPTEQQILNQLGRAQGGNPLVEAYVKWQLLSGIEETFSAERADDAVRLLVNAPQLPTMPGAVPDVQRKLEEAVRRVRGDKEGRLSPEDSQLLASVNEQLSAETTRIIDDHQLLITYRQELIKRIPTTDDKAKALLMKARIEDLWQRGEAGFPVQDSFKTLAAEIRTWAAVGDKESINKMAQFIGEYARRSPKQVYAGVEWKDKKINWNRRAAGLDIKELQKLENDLKEAAKNAMNF